MARPTNRSNNLFKKWFKGERFRIFICWAIAHYIRFVYYTSRRQMTMPEATRPYVEGKSQAVYAFWHGRLLLMPMLCPPGRKMQVLISTHRDGELIARTMHNFGFGTVRGSTTRGGVTAAMNAVKALQAGDNVSVTPDGPKGPAMVVQPGILTIAELANVPVIVATYHSSRNRRMKSWDRFMVALPFSTIYFALSAPLFAVGKETLEAEMIRLTEEVDNH